MLLQREILKKSKNVKHPTGFCKLHLVYFVWIFYINYFLYTHTHTCVCYFTIHGTTNFLKIITVVCLNFFFSIPAENNFYSKYLSIIFQLHLLIPTLIFYLKMKESLKIVFMSHLPGRM